MADEEVLWMHEWKILVKKRTVCMKTRDWCYCKAVCMSLLIPHCPCLSSFSLSFHVLSCLHLSLPTGVVALASWQCVGVCLVILVESAATSRLSELNPWSARQVVRWLPLGFLVAVDLYTKSRALTQLDVPNYILMELSLLTMTDGVVLIGRYLSVQELQDQWRNTGLLLIGCFLCLVLSALLVELDTEVPRDAYVWALMHCGIEATMNLLIWSTLQPSRDQCFWTHLMSMALLIPVGYVLGQVHKAWDTPVAMESQFMTAFFTSSLLAGATALTHLWAQQYSDGQSKMAVILGKGLLFLLGFVVYNNQFGSAEGLILFVGSVVCLGLQVHMLTNSQSGRVEHFSVSASSTQLSLLV